MFFNQLTTRILCLGINACCKFTDAVIRSNDYKRYNHSYYDKEKARQEIIYPNFYKRIHLFIYDTEHIDRTDFLFFLQFNR
jgi:hypothetical protein